MPDEEPKVVPTPGRSANKLADQNRDDLDALKKLAQADQADMADIKPRVAKLESAKPMEP